MYSGSYVFPRVERVVFGRDAADVVTEEAIRGGSERVFVLVPELLQRADVVQRIAEALGARNAGTWSGITAHTPREDVVAATAAARAAGADLLVTLGGGSIIDAGKVVQTCLANDVVDVSQLDALRKLPGDPMTSVRAGMKPPKVRTIAVPTTLAGAEFTQYAGVTNAQIKLKEVFTHPLQTPKAVVLDPHATVHTPDWLWLSTGIRALDHAVEDICSIDAQPFSEGSAMQAIRLLSRALPATFKDRSGLEARLDAQIGCWLSLIGSQTGVNKGASHAIGHALGGTGGVPHGYTSCVLMPHVLRFNEPAVARRQALISEAFGQAGANAADLVAALIEGLGLPRTLRDVGITTDDQIEAITDASMQDPWIKTNPRPMDRAQVRAILEAAR